MKIKTNFVPDNSKAFLTTGKEYEVSKEGFIIDDEGDKILTYQPACKHLDSRAWEICDATD